MGQGAEILRGIDKDNHIHLAEYRFDALWQRVRISKRIRGENITVRAERYAVHYKMT